MAEQTFCKAASCPCRNGAIDPDTGTCDQCDHDYRRHMAWDPQEQGELLAKIATIGSRLTHALCLLCGERLGVGGGELDFRMSTLPAHLKRAHGEPQTVGGTPMRAPGEVGVMFIGRML